MRIIILWTSIRTRTGKRKWGYDGEDKEDNEEEGIGASYFEEDMMSE